MSMLESLQSLFNVQALLTAILAWLPNLITALLIFIAFRVAIHLLSPHLERAFQRMQLEAAITGMMLSLFRTVMLVLAVVMSLGQLGVDVAAALAGIGVLGLSIGFAAQDSLSNVIAGFLILMDKPFTTNDWITVGDQKGRVVEISMRTTRLRTRSNTYVIIPNKTLLDQVLVNHSRHGATRIEVPVGIAYKESISNARAVLLAAVAKLPDVLTEPAARVDVLSLDDSAVSLEVEVWIANAEDEEDISAAVVEVCKLALDEAGIQIPFPHLQLFVDAVEAGVWDQARRLVGKA
ncbi:MAG: mechanosensitive ion channel family protein [Bryobacteraceae bacterium]